MPDRDTTEPAQPAGVAYAPPGDHQLSQSELTNVQIAILDAVPAQIALIDERGMIVSVNEAWRRFARGNGYDETGFGLGRNYLQVTDSAAGDCSAESPAVSAGIRAVLAREVASFELEYPCHSPTEKRWFRLTVTPLYEGTGGGAVVMHINITERRLAEIAAAEAAETQGRLGASLTAERERLVAAQRVAKVGSWETNLTTLNVIWSEETFRIFGLDRERFTPTHETFLSHVHPDDRARVDEAFRKSAGTRELCVIEHRIVLADGTVKVVEERWQTPGDANGASVRAVGTCQDITERQAAAAALHLLDQRFRQIFDSAATGIVVASTDGKFVDANGAYCRILGYERDELIGMSYRDITPPEDMAVSDEVAQAIFSGRRPSADFVKRYLTKSGKQIWARVSTASAHDSEGRIAGSITVVTDISREREVELRLIQQAALLDAAHDAILVADMDDRILYWNKGAEQTYGWTSAEALGRETEELFRTDAAHYREAREQLLAEGKWEGELVKHGSDGKPRTVAVRWTLVRDEKGRAVSVLAIHTDITNRKRLEAQLLRAQRLESLGTLAGGIAHDLNNVLAPILVGIDLLRINDDDPLRVKALTTMESSAQRGAELVRQMLSFARGEAGSRRAVNIADVARDVNSILRQTVPKNVSIVLDIAPDLWMVLGDSTQLHQIFMNLAVNARDAMPDGGVITISVANCVFDETYAGMNPSAQAGPYVQIIVSDTGTGISKADQERLFEPFFTTKDPGKGTGLGLSTVHTIVRTHGGFIEVFSEIGHGARFTVSLPAIVSHVEGTATAQLPLDLVRGNGELVLVVDDEDPILSIVQQTLERHGYRVLLARNGAEGISRYVQHLGAIAVVLTDLAMPVMDGASMIVALKAIDPEARIIVSSGLVSEKSLASALGAGVKTFVPKPYTADTLLAALHRLLHSPQ